MGVGVWGPQLLKNGGKGSPTSVQGKKKAGRIEKT